MADKSFSEGGIFAVLENVVAGGLDRIGTLAKGAAESIGSGISSVGSVFSEVTSVSLGSMFGSSPSTEQSAAKTPAVQEPAAAVAIAPANRPFEVSMSELGGFSAPTFGGAPIGRGSGIGVG